ncbi:MAG: peptidylprolyl isomerase [Bacteroidota bacterium]
MRKTIAAILVMLFLVTLSYAQDTELKFLIKTSYGDIKIKLYNDTPLHKENFLKNVNNGFYNGSTFHRVIASFMIQGGRGINGADDCGWTVAAEIMPNHFHKKGALAAARMGDNVNPKKASSGSQFYIVQGKKYTDADLDAFEARTGKKYTKEQRDAYKTIGGTPHLDGDYTVFGEVYEGLDVVDKIAAAKTDAGSKPVEDIKMTITQIK